MIDLNDIRKVGKKIDGKVPVVDHPKDAWDSRTFDYKLVSPNNRRKFNIIVIGTGLAGSGVAAALGELGYNVDAFCYHDLPRRAHSVAAQGGINAARARKVDNDSIERFVKDTVKGGDFRGREVDAYRLGIESLRVIDHMNAIGAPFAREYGGKLATRSFGGVQVSRTYYTRGQTGQQLQVAAAHALSRQVAKGTVKLHARQEMLDLIVKDGVAKGVVVRDLVSGKVRACTAHAVVLGTGGYGNLFYKSTLAKMSNATASWRSYKKGAYFANPCFVQIHPTALPLMSDFQSKRILMSESLRNDGRIWCPKKKNDNRPANEIPENERDYFLERKYPAFGNLVPRDVASRAIFEKINEGYGVGKLKNAVYLDFADALKRLGKKIVWERYSNLFEMYQKHTGDDPLKTPMMIAPSPHFSMGGLWSDYNMQTSIKGLFVGGEVGWGYHGANRLGANSLLSASVDGWFTLPYSIPDYLSEHLGEEPLPLDSPEVQTSLTNTKNQLERMLQINGKHAPNDFYKKLGDVMNKYVAINRDPKNLTKALYEIRDIRKAFWKDLKVVGTENTVNQELELAGRVADYLEMAELLCIDALDREESCGAHFRVDHQTPEGEALRDDKNWAFCSAWEYTGANGKPIRNMEDLFFKVIKMQQRNYK
jgi:succinate dehydrogenase / fumarate reductase flavoprotein subunit